MIDKSLVKSIIQLKTDAHDQYIETMIPLVQEYAADKCNVSLTDNIPGGIKIFIAKAIEYNMLKAGITSRTMGEVSYSYSLDFPTSILDYLKPYRRLKW